VMHPRCLSALAFVALMAGRASAADDPKKPEKAGPVKNLTETTHTITVHGAKIEYKATAGTLPLMDDNGKTIANVFFIAYTQPGHKASDRPITFAFNGGPGSSSVWLHLGVLGPRRIGAADVGDRPVPPYRLVDNESTLLDVSDLVFIDPVSTGYSRPASGQNAKQFHGVQEDIHSVGAFIDAYTTRFRRWDSPKFLAGESYGTTRAAGLADYMQDHFGMYFNGIILISAVLNFQTLSQGPGNDLPYLLYLPSFAATAWYHKKLSKDFHGDLATLLDEAEHFATNEYSVALFKGDRLSASERKNIAQKLSHFTGLPEDFIRRANLRVSMGEFNTRLLRDRDLVIGRYDSRYTGRAISPLNMRQNYDPSYTAVQGEFTALFNEYVKRDLKYETKEHYEILTSKVQPWNFGAARGGYLNVATDLRDAMMKNPQLHVFVANGHFDLATPFFATQYTFDHMNLGEKLRKHVTMGFYEAGHMMYLHPPSRQKLHKDLSDFIHKAVAG